MKIQFLNGGLANQSFQYIFARYHELSHPGEIMYMDDSYFAIDTVHNGYELEKVFGIRPHMLSECFDEDVWAFILEERKKGKSVPQIFLEEQIEITMLSEVGDGHKTFNPFDGQVLDVPCNRYLPEILDLPGNLYYHGYWINKKWFARYREEFLREFTFPDITDERNLRYMDEIRSSLSLSVHIRRGDFVTGGLLQDPKIYRYSLERLAKEVPGEWHLFVFSDDIGWCREHADELGICYFREITYVEGNKDGEDYRDMQLMSMCRAMVVSNSSFCCLASLLNTEKQYVLNTSGWEV